MSFWKHLFSRKSESNSFYLPNGTIKESQIVSPNSARFAYAVQDWRGIHVEVNGKKLGRKYNAVAGITFSLDSQHIAYASYLKDRWFVVFDETEYEEWDDIGKTSPVISPDSKHIAYTAQRGNQWFTVLDGKIVGGPYDGFSAGGIVFSPNSQRIVYVAKRATSWFAVIDGKEHKTFPSIIERSWTFSPDSKRVAYVAGIDGSWLGHAFVGEAAIIIDDEIQQVWKHDGTTKWDGLTDEIYFSPDSRRIAYVVVQNGKAFFVIDDVPQRKYDTISSGWGNLWNIFSDHKKASSKRERIVFSPNSRHFSYAAADGNQHVLVYDSKEKARHKSIIEGPIVFSPNSERLAYGIEDESRKQFLVVDWSVGKSYDGLPGIAYSFSPDSAHIAYVASERYKYLLVTDSRVWQLHGGPLVGAKIVWDDNEHLHTLVGEGRKVNIERLFIA